MVSDSTTGRVHEGFVGHKEDRVEGRDTVNETKEQNEREGRIFEIVLSVVTHGRRVVLHTI